MWRDADGCRSTSTNWGWLRVNDHRTFTDKKPRLHQQKWEGRGKETHVHVQGLHLETMNQCFYASIFLDFRWHDESEKLFATLTETPVSDSRTFTYRHGDVTSKTARVATQKPIAYCSLYIPSAYSGGILKLCKISKHRHFSRWTSYESTGGSGGSGAEEPADGPSLGRAWLPWSRVASLGEAWLMVAGMVVVVGR